MKNGPILEIAKRSVSAAYYFNIVELFKYTAGKIQEFIGNSDKAKIIYAKSLAIDFYILVKWLAVFILWASGSDGAFGLILTGYLLWSNVFTYFYYHVWENRQSNDLNWQRRRFVSLIQSIAFHVFGFAYIYRFTGFTLFNWKIAGTGASGQSFQSLAFSILNLFGSGSSVAEPHSAGGVLILICQTTITFIFLTLILANTPINKETP